MNDETASAPAEGEALPASVPPPLPKSWNEHAEPAPASAAHPVLAALERWYAEHFHRAAVEGRAPITADDKAALAQALTDAVSTPKE